MTRNQPFALAYEVERTLYESSSSWEGIDAQEIPLSEGEVVLQAQTVTSAPILIKRGFKPVCRFVGLARKRPASTTSTYDC